MFVSGVFTSEQILKQYILGNKTQLRGKVRHIKSIKHKRSKKDLLRGNRAH